MSCLVRTAICNLPHSHNTQEHYHGSECPHKIQIVVDTAVSALGTEKEAIPILATVLSYVHVCMNPLVLAGGHLNYVSHLVI